VDRRYLAIAENSISNNSTLFVSIIGNAISDVDAGTMLAEQTNEVISASSVERSQILVGMRSLFY